MRPFAFLKLSATNEALAKKTKSAQYIAGGTNLVDLMKKQIAQPENLVDVTSALPNRIELTSAGLSIGAMATNSLVATDSNILTKFPLVSKAILAGASPQIRNMASTGGNLLQRTRCPYFYDVTTPCNKRNPGSGCSAIEGDNRMSAIVGYSDKCIAVHPSDLCVALVALDASVNIVDKQGKKKSITFQDFHRLPGNTPELDNNLPHDALIETIQLPNNRFAKNSAYVKIRDRESYAFALVSVAAALHLDGDKIVAARLASGGVAHKPWRWTAAEQYLAGKTANAKTFEAAANIASEGLEPQSHNGFKIPMLKGAIETALQQCLNP